MLIQVYEGHDRVISIAIFTIALTINGAVTAGYLSNGLDIAPNFSGTIFGMANTLSSLGGFLSALMVGTLTQDNVSNPRKVIRVYKGQIEANRANGQFSLDHQN